jgi:ribosomal protein S18 acetylase RimI-like enzyme
VPNNKLLLKYLKIITKSDKIDLFTCEFNRKIIGYIIISKKPKDLFNEFKVIKKEIFYYLVKKIKISILLNLLIKFLKIDLIFISPNNKEIIEKNINLNMIGIESKFQSMGIGYFFLKKVILIITYKGDYKYLSLETLNYRAENFYKKKFNFYYIGLKLRFYKNLKILLKKL